MNAPIDTSGLSRRAFPQGRRPHCRVCARRPADGRSRAGRCRAGRVLDPKEVDAFLAVNGDGTVTVFCGKVDLGQGLRIAIPQIAAEELGIGVDKIKFVEGDTALTPDQGRTSGSNGIQRGGMQIRQAAATARKGLIELAAQRLNVKPEDLVAADGQVRPEVRRRRHRLCPADRRSQARPQARSQGAAQGSLDLHHRRQVAAAAGRAGQMRPGSHVYMQDFQRAGHAACARDPAARDRRQARFGRRVLDRASSRREGGADQGFPRRRRRGRMDMWCAPPRALAGAMERRVRAAGAGRRWPKRCAASPAWATRSLVNKGTRRRRMPDGTKALKATYFWPMQSHASIGPSCAVADVRADSATIWTASQGTHGNRNAFCRASSACRARRCG